MQMQVQKEEEGTLGSARKTRFFGVHGNGISGIPKSFYFLWRAANEVRVPNPRFLPER